MARGEIADDVNFRTHCQPEDSGGNGLTERIGAVIQEQRTSDYGKQKYHCTYQVCPEPIEQKSSSDASYQ